MKSFFLFLMLASLIHPVANAADNKAADNKKVEEGAPPKSDFFRCVRMRSSSIADLKARLVTECNLSKPFAFSNSEMLSSEATYTFCCHKE